MAKSLHSKAYKRLIELLVQARQDAGLTQQQVADELGKPQSFVAKYENGERRLDVIELIDICRVIGASPVEIVETLQSR